MCVVQSSGLDALIVRVMNGQVLITDEFVQGYRPEWPDPSNDVTVEGKCFFCLFVWFSVVYLALKTSFRGIMLVGRKRRLILTKKKKIVAGK
jgi:hypothetical protein